MSNSNAEPTGYYKVDCSDCDGESLHHPNYGFIICYGCLESEKSFNIED